MGFSGAEEFPSIAVFGLFHLNEPDSLGLEANSRLGRNMTPDVVSATVDTAVREAGVHQTAGESFSSASRS